MLADRLGKMLAGEGFRVGKLQGPPLEPADLVAAVARACRIDGPCDTEAALAARLVDVPAGSRGLLIIEEAQRLEPDALVQLGRVSAMLPDGALSILLVGQTELTEILSAEENAALRHRVTARCAVEPLPPDEVGPYVQHRLHMAGAARAIFSPNAIGRIASLSRGAPGMINVICGRALLAGHVRRAQVIDEEIVDAGLSIRAAESPGTTPGAVQAAAGRATDRAARRPPVTAARRARRALLSYGVPAIAVAIFAVYAVQAGWVARAAGWLAGTATPPGQRTSSVLSPTPSETKAGRDVNAPVAVAEPQVTPARAESPDLQGRSDRARAPDSVAVAPADTNAGAGAQPAPPARRSDVPAAGQERAPEGPVAARGLRAQGRAESPAVEGRPEQTRPLDNAAPAAVDTKAAAPAQPAAPAKRPAPAPDRERAASDTPTRSAPQTRDRETDPGDGSAIIDWLLNEGGRR
jgi:hypothetical protein